MKAVSRLGMLAFAAALMPASQALAQSIPATAQQTAPPPSSAPAANAPAQDAVGPRELRNFSIGGTVIRPAEPAPRTAPPARSPSESAAPSTSAAPPPVPTRSEAVRQGRAAGGAEARAKNPASASAQATVPQPTPSAPSETTTAAPAPAPAATFTPEPEPSSSGLAATHGFPILPWLLAALLLAGGLGFLLWRRRPREALAGGPDLGAYVPPEPLQPPAAPRNAAPPPTRVPSEPAPAPVVRRIAGTVRAFATAPESDKPVGVVSTRLRPWLDITIVPTAVRMDEQQVAFEFEVEVYNSGAAPARDIQLAATLFNASPTQEQDVAAFIAQPVAEGDALPPVPPLQRVAFRHALFAQRASLQLFEAGGRQMFVPILAFNAVYRWSGGEGQSAGSCLIGRDTGADKLAPLRADLGPRAFDGLGARPLPTGMRR